MKFLMTLFEIQDYGGIINHLETLALGLKELGHEVDFTILVPRESVQDKKTTVDERDGWRTLGTGYPFHQQKGWRNVQRHPYRGDWNIKAFKDRASLYDAVFWHIPVPTLSKHNEGVLDWLKLYDHSAKNFAIIHDGNLPRLYPHLEVVSSHFTGLICVHESAYESARTVGLPRVLIPNPFIVEPWFLPPDLREGGFVAFQVFKAWKRVDTLIRAIPHMKNNRSKIIGGGGIEQRYMTSVDKCKPQYIEAGEPIWNRALKAGMSYAGFQPQYEVFKCLQNARLQIDPSWSKKYAAYGAHFNRTTIEAMINGTVPMATDLGMKDSKFFKPGENFIEIPHTATPKEFAQLVDDSMEDTKKLYDIQKNNISLIREFDHKDIAARYIWLVRNPLPKPEYQTSPELIAAGQKNMEFFSDNH